MAEHILHGAFQHLKLHFPLLKSLWQRLVVGSTREVHVATTIDCRCRFVHGLSNTRQLVDSSVITHYHAVETKIATQDIIEYFTVGNTVDGVAITVRHCMVARHDNSTTSQTNHRFVREKNLFHQLFLFGIATTSITQIVLRTGSNAFFQTTLL